MDPGFDLYRSGVVAIVLAPGCWWMLKWVPVSGGEASGARLRLVFLPGGGHCEVATATCCRSDLPVATRHWSAPGGASYRNLERRASQIEVTPRMRSQRQKASGGRLQASRSRQSRPTHSQPRTGAFFSIHR